MAIGSNSHQVVEFLLDHKARLDLTMSAAARHADVRMLELLTKRGADINASGKELSTPLLEAIGGMHTHWLTAPPLIQAAGQRCSENARWLIEHGADVNRADPWKNGRTPVFAAAAGGEEEILSLLLQRHAKLDVPITGGQTALGVANERLDRKIIDMLQKAGAKR
jgi:ankyrin repeat protein